MMSPAAHPPRQASTLRAPRFDRPRQASEEYYTRRFSGIGMPGTVAVISMVRGRVFVFLRFINSAH